MESRPLVHCITNYVAMNFTANALLAVGATPLMSFCPEEMVEIVSKCDALLVNIGCLDRQQIEAMRIAVDAAKRYGKPWVLDPVGMGFTELRTRTCMDLIGIHPPVIIRGNRRELINEDRARMLAGKTGGAVVMSGELDFLTDGDTDMTVGYGDRIMTQVTAMGCVATAVCASFVARLGNPLDAAFRAMTLVGKAGENAAKVCRGTGSFKMEFIDELYRQSAQVISCD